MSLYILGKVSSESAQQDALRRQMQSIAATIDIDVMLDQLDSSEVEALDDMYPAPHNLYFNVNSSREEDEGSSLWNEANQLAQEVLRASMGERFVYSANAIPNAEWPNDYVEQMKNCRLGRFLFALVAMSGYQGIGIGLFDNEIDSTFRGTAKECLEEILKMVLLPWDCGPNVFYIWDHPVMQKL